MYSDYDTMWAMLRAAHSPSDFSLRRTLFADGLISLASLVGGVNRAFERLDQVLYPEATQTALGSPLFIVAAPRSGTTFLHRMLSLDEQFTTFKLYETFFPTVTGHKLTQRFANANGRLGHLLGSLRSRVDGSSFGAWEGIHDTGLGQDEEDEAIWALAFATPAIWLVLPYPEKFEHLRFIDRLPEEKKEALASYYRACVQKHLYTHPHKTLLGKNVLLPGRFEIVSRALPDSRFVHVVRHPYEAIPSTLSLFTIPWQWHSPRVRLDGAEARAMAKLMLDYYRLLHEKSIEDGAQARFHSVRYDDLLAEPEASVEQIYRRLGISFSESTQEKLRKYCARERSYQSHHHYSLEQFGLSKEFVYEELKDVFQYYGFER